MKINFQLIISCLFLFLNSNLSSAQAPEIQWQKTIGGTNSEGSTQIQQTTDGGFIAGGLTFSNDIDVSGLQGSFDFFVVKLIDDGEIEWTKTYGGSGEDYLRSLQQTTDGGYILAGYTTSTNGDVSFNYGGSDFWVVKINAIGDIEWEKTYGGSNEDAAYSIQQTLDGGYIVAGYTGSNNGDVIGNLGYDDYWVVKLTSEGIIEWQKTYGGSYYDRAYFVQQTTDSGYILIGSASSSDGDLEINYGVDDIFIVKISSEGDIEWKKSFGGSGFDYSFSAIQANDGGYIISGYTDSTDISGITNLGFVDCLIIKLDTNGTIEWQKIYGGSNVELLSSIKKTADGGYIFTGFTNSDDIDVSVTYGNRDYWVVKLNALGTIEWEKTYGGTSFDSGTDIQQTTDGGYVILGSSTSNDVDVSVNYGNEDYWIVKLGPDNLSLSNFSETTTISLYPNPTQDKLTIKLNYFEPSLEMNITDILGKKIHSQKLDGLSTSINTSSLKSGVYLVTILNGNQKITQRFIKS